MLEFIAIRKFIRSPKNLNDYVKKLKPTELISLLNELTTVTKAPKTRKNDKNPGVRLLKSNLSKKEYTRLMSKLVLFLYEDQVFTLTKKETVLHLISTFTTVLFGSFSGFVGLLTALGMEISFGTLGLILAAVSIISLLIAFIWHHRLKITNQESKENKKLLNFHIEALKHYNFNKISRILAIINALKAKLELDSIREIDYSHLKEEPIIALIDENLVTINEAFNGLNNSFHASLTASAEKMYPNKAEWQQRLSNLSALLKFQDIDRTFDIIKNADNPVDNPRFFKWFRTNTSLILLKVFDESKTLLASVVLGTVVGLVTLKLVAEVALLTALLTTPIGVATLISIIVVVVLSSMIFTVYDMYKNSKRTNINNNMHHIIEREEKIKEQLKSIEQELEQLLPLVENPNVTFLPSLYDTAFMQEIMQADQSKWEELKAYLAEKKLKLTKENKAFLQKKPLLVLKLIKKLKDDMISNRQELGNFFEKYGAPHSFLGSTGDSPHQITTLISNFSDYTDKSGAQAFNKIKSTPQHAKNKQLRLAISYIEVQVSQKNAYAFIKPNRKRIKSIATEVAKRLNDQDSDRQKKLRAHLENCKYMRKEVLNILLEENITLQNRFKDYIAEIKPTHSREEEKIEPIRNLSSDEENSVLLNETQQTDKNYDEYREMKDIEESLQFDPYTVTINELISKKQSAARNYEKSTLAKENTYLNFWKSPYRQNQKVAETFVHMGITLQLKS